MANAKANGKVIGRPALTVEDVPKDFLRHYPKYKNKEITKTEFSRLIGVSRPTLDKYIKLLDERV